MSSAVDALGLSSPTTPAPTGFSALTAQDFSKIIFTELSKQDPLQPNDTNALLQQISSVRSIQSDMDLSDKLQSLVNENEFSSAATLIGKKVSGIDDTNQRVTGIVKSLSKTSTGTYLTLEGGQRVSVGNLDEIDDTPVTPTNPVTPPVNPTPPVPPAPVTPTPAHPTPVVVTPGGPA